jgi:VWFA-related protein
MVYRLAAALTLAAAAAGGATALAAQQATFRASVEVIEIDVYVADEAGRPVTGLTADDFTVLENGEPRPIRAFSAIDLPIERVQPVRQALARLDVLSNHNPPGRVYLFTFAALLGSDILKARHFARQFIEQHFGPNDVGAVALLGPGRPDAVQDFTGSPRLLLQAIDRFTGGFPKINVASDAPPGYVPTPDPAPGIRRGGRSDYLERLRMLTEMTARMPGHHKAMLLFTSAPPVDMYDLIDYNGGVLSVAGEDAHAAMSAATRSNLAIYPIDPRGLSTDLLPLGEVAAYRALADATGGAALVNSNNWPVLFETIVRDNSAYYMLGFEPKAVRDDGRYVRLEVVVARPGVHVRTRGGYLAPLRDSQRRPARSQQPRPAPTSATARLESPIPTDGIPMRVFAAPFKGLSNDMATVALVLALDMSYIANGAGNRDLYPEVRHVARIPAATIPAGSPAGQARVRLFTDVQLREGRYQLRFASASAGVAGSVVYDLEIPDFDDVDLALSGLALISRSEMAVLTLRPDAGAGRLRPAECDASWCEPPLGPSPSPVRPVAETKVEPLVHGVLPGPPTARRAFTTTEDLVLVAELYEKRGRRDMPNRVALSASLRGDDGRVIPLSSENRSSTAARSASGGHTFVLRLPLTSVPAGDYALLVEARSDGRNAPAVTREIAIEIR